MRRFFFVPVLALAAFLLLAPTQLRADGFDNFTFTDVASDNSFSLVMTWQLPSNPTPDPAIPGAGFELYSVNVSQILDGVDQGIVIDSMAFTNANTSELPWQFLDLYASLSGSGSMYSGDESSPTFLPGTYSGVDFVNLDLNGAPSNATLSIVSTPEPSSILMLMIGFLALAGILTAKKAIASVSLNPPDQTAALPPARRRFFLRIHLACQISPPTVK